ncbi:MAG: Gfo/Idh/MocA family protein [Fimbriimonadaceae bacterium]
MKVGVLGCGGMGNVHSSKYSQMSGVALYAYDQDAERQSALCERHGAEPVGSRDALIEVCDVLDVCLPTTLHTDAVVAGLEAGKPTLVEKPMGRTNEDCLRMCDATAQTGTLLMPAQVARWFREHRAAHEAVRDGRIGRPASVRLRRGGGAPRGEWFLDHAASGGILLDLAVHDFDWLLWTLGPAQRVTSRTVRLGQTVAGAEFKGDFAQTTVLFQSGAVATVVNTWMDPAGFRTTIEAAGDGGLIEFDSRTNPAIRVASAGGQRAENPYAAEDDPYYSQLSAFLAAARGEAPVPIKPEEGAAAVRLALAAIESAETGQPVLMHGP